MTYTMVKGLVMDDETLAALFNIFEEGFKLAVKVCQDQEFNDLSPSEVQQRMHNRFESYLLELKGG
jgi:hypothetical protein